MKGRIRNDTGGHPLIEYFLILVLVLLVVVGLVITLDNFYGRFFHPSVPTVVNDSVRLQRAMEAANTIYLSLQALEDFEPREKEEVLSLLILMQSKIQSLQEMEKIRDG